jgi:photosystem II stability/assembly factor-like uncharacterized protein
MSIQNRIIILAVTIGLIAFTAFFVYPPASIQEAEADEDPTAPNRHLMEMRTWPDAVFDYQAFQQGLDEARMQESQRGNNLGADVPWRLEGSTNIGGKINHIAIHPSNPKIIYLSTPNGGIFKTTDAGKNWTPIFDNQPSLSVSYICFNPQNSETIWAGTGDVDIQGYPVVGAGVFKSTNGGQDWTAQGLKETGIISKIAIDPNDSQIIYASTMGIPMSPDSNRGLYKSTDGGTTWAKKLYISTDAGIIDFILDKTNSQHIIAAAFDRLAGDTVYKTGGSGSGIWESMDGGTNWNLQNTTQGIPTYTFSRIGFHQHSKYPNIVFAAITDKSTQGYKTLLKSNDYGSNWASTTLPASVSSPYDWYFGRIYSDPNDTNELYLMGVDQYKSNDGGGNWARCTPVWSADIVHGDGHGMAFLGSDSIYLATDGGLYLSTNNAANWTNADNIPNTEYYRIAINPFLQGNYSGGAQDNGTSDGSYDTYDTWQKTYGGDGFQPLFDYEDDQVRYFTTQNGNVSSSNRSGILSRGGGSRPNWDMPFIMSRFNPKILYAASEYVVKNVNGENGSFKKSSPDLTGGTGNISALAENNVTPNLIYAGTSTARAWRSYNAGKTWDSITPGLPKRYITSIKTSYIDSQLIYISHTGYRLNEYIPHIHRSYNNGTTWEDISKNLPPVGINDICTWPKNDSILFVATDAGVYASLDAAQTWQHLGKDMPLYPVFDIEIDTITHRLIAGTFARSMLSFPLDSIIYWPKSNVSINRITQADTPLKIYPNPVSDILHIETVGNKPSQFLLYNLEGKLIIQKASTGQHHQLSISHLPSGMYMLVCTQGKETYYEKIIKQ